MSSIGEYILSKLNANSDESILESSSFSYKGMIYRPGMSIIVEIGPKFLIIDKILKYNEKIYFFGNIHNSFKLINKNAFTMEENFVKGMFPLDHLGNNYQSYEVYKLQNNYYIFPFFQVLHYEMI